MTCSVWAEDGRESSFHTPVDIIRKIDTHFSRHLASGWWIDPPQGLGRRLDIVVNIPDDWRGNPAGAMIALCPDWRSAIWQDIDRLTLIPTYRTLRWATTECRR